jgi:hypothetical protein
MEPLATIAETTRFAALRGPRPPAAVCPHCDATVFDAWENPFLVRLKARGSYMGDTRGGAVSCATCLAAQDARLAALTGEAERKRPRVVIDAPTWAGRATLDSYRETPWNRAVVRRVTDWLGPRDRDLYLYGPPGTGKTHLAVALGRALVETGAIASARFVRVPSLIRRLRASFDDRDALDLADYLRGADLLILDDLGAEHGTAFTASTIEGLYAERIDAGLRTILTSNLPVTLPLHDAADEPVYHETLGAHLGDDRMPSRIAGFAELLELNGSDFRSSGWRGRVGGAR